LNCRLYYLDRRKGALTTRELMEAQRKRVSSCNPAERLAAALLITAELSRRLRLLSNSEIAQLLDHEVCGNLSILAPEATVCVECTVPFCLLRMRPARGEVFIFRKAILKTSWLNNMHPLTRGDDYCTFRAWAVTSCVWCVSNSPFPTDKTDSGSTAVENAVTPTHMGHW